MNHRIFTIAAAIALTGTLGTIARADQKTGVQEAQARNTFMGHRVLSVAPSWVGVFGKEQFRHLAGADIRIEAEPGMTAEYLTVEVRRVLASAATREVPNSVLGVEGANVEVRSAGDGFIVRITSNDSRSAQEIVRRARLLT